MPRHLLPYYACQVCCHGADAGIERVCRHPQLLDMGEPQPVAQLRGPGAACGPKAQYMQAAEHTQARPA